MAIWKNALSVGRLTEESLQVKSHTSKYTLGRLPLEETLSRTPRAPDLNVDFVFGDCSTCRLLSVVDRAFSTSTLKSGGRGSPSRQDFYTKQKMEFYILLANFLPSTVPMRGCWVCATTTKARQV